jgi:hypothetical protein
VKYVTKILAALAIALGISTPALAYDGDVTGTLYYTFATLGSNYGFRAQFNGYGATAHCSGSTNYFVYVNEGSSNYALYTAMLSSAQAEGRTVRIYSTNVGGFCQIQGVTVY